MLKNLPVMQGSSCLTSASEDLLEKGSLIPLPVVFLRILRMRSLAGQLSMVTKSFSNWACAQEKKITSGEANNLNGQKTLIQMANIPLNQKGVH